MRDGCQLKQDQMSSEDIINEYVIQMRGASLRSEDSLERASLKVQMKFERILVQTIKDHINHQLKS